MGVEMHQGLGPDEVSTWKEGKEYKAPLAGVAEESFLAPDEAEEGLWTGGRGAVEETELERDTEMEPEEVLSNESGLASPGTLLAVETMESGVLEEGEEEEEEEAL